MKYTTILTHQSGQLWHAVVPALPDCKAEATTRTEVIEKIKSRIHTVLKYTEVLQIEISERPQNGASGTSQTNEESDDAIVITPQAWMGAFQNDPSWGEIFDQIEQEREQQIIGG